MSLIWCTRRGDAKGFKQELAACVACDCRKRKRCKAWAELPLEQIAAANREAKANGHAVFENYPLFESVAGSQTVSD